MHISTKIQDYLRRKRGIVEVESPPEVEVTPKDELVEAWEEWKYHFRTPLMLIKWVVITISILTVIGAMATVQI